MQEKIRVWDLPTRLFHWALAICLAGSLVSVNLGGNAVGWHFRFGYAMLALLLFRVAWGFVGPRYSRFASFPPSPAAALRHLRGEGVDRPGHSPLAALSVYALLLALAIQAGTGLFANDAIMWDGPLKNLVTNATSDTLTRLHKLNRFVVIGLVLLHLAAIAFYTFVKRRRLVAAMITGDAAVRPPPGAAAARDSGDVRASGKPRGHRADHTAEPARDDARVRLKALSLLAASAAAVWSLVEFSAAAL
ncbi:cytochrome b/b6 domain-containing protein [Quisquiliibacterium transsilvanicum]|uniref:Cytochrome b n=1 Tax=Quisquiliibacterium transsilvanicum TaxID=1549638 RepID=A0A7W8HGG8_9BURK|nr:cytochrome b/b6 domain-containing protein [Quisquiliibacterium transsilvanicum]MBB5271488.1 cytochrome b [Quisquiliibacterium transsilvanicum]